jgi:hypothetical protein
VVVVFPAVVPRSGAQAQTYAYLPAGTWIFHVASIVPSAFGPTRSHTRSFAFVGSRFTCIFARSKGSLGGSGLQMWFDSTSSPLRKEARDLVPGKVWPSRHRDWPKIQLIVTVALKASSVRLGRNKGPEPVLRNHSSLSRSHC